MRRRACEGFRDNVQSVLEFLGAMALLIWMILRHRRLHEDGVET